MYGRSLAGKAGLAEGFEFVTIKHNRLMTHFIVDVIPDGHRYWSLIKFLNGDNYVFKIQQNLQQTHVIGCKELLEQKLNKVYTRRANADNEIERRTCDLTLEKIKSAIMVINDL